MHEAQMHPQNSFITLTWDPAKLRTLSLVHRDWQLFMKRTRRALAPKQVRYYMAGEYGSEHRRPHFHACLFGHDFADKKYWRTTGSKSKLYTSATLDELWGNGFTSVGSVNFESAAYIARYIMDKITGQNAGMFYEHCDELTGELTELLPEYNRMSLRPAIGKTWYQKYKTDAYPEGELLVRGHKSKTPKYYDKQFKEEDPDAHEAMKMQREMQSLEYRGDNTPERLRVKETVTRAKINQLIRKL